MFILHVLGPADGKKTESKTNKKSGLEKPQRERTVISHSVQALPLVKGQQGCAERAQ